MKKPRQKDRHREAAAPRPRWVRPVVIRLPTWRIWLPGLLLLGVVLVSAARSTHDFLSLSRPVSANVLVVEGWLPDYALEQAIQEFADGRYEMLITTGGPIERGSLLFRYANHAEMTAANLGELGFDPERLVAVPADAVTRNRTYASARAVRTWLEQSPLQPRGVTVVSLGPHARRSWAAYRKSLGPGFDVGVLAVTPRDYDPARWWASSEGMKTTLTELVAWLHEYLFDSGR